MDLKSVLLRLIPVCALMLALSSCQEKEKPVNKRIKQLDPARVEEMARAIESSVTPRLAEGLTLSVWGVDSLVADPVSIDIDDQGRLYYTRTNRQKNSEFDIRGHQDWELESIQLTTIEEKRAFLRKTLSPENSEKNKWLADLNKDGSHDWRDMTIEKEQVFRLEDTSGDGRADLSQLVVEDFHEEVTDAAGGVLKHNGDLFVGIGPDLWRVEEDKNGLASKITSISHGYGIHVGFSGHGMSGIEVGPDGKIYWQIGDIGFNGVDKDGKKWEHPNSGVIVRSNPDGSDFEVFAYGNRNTHEFVFDEYGNLISEDNDGDHPGESERIVYVVYGADIGWRTNWQFGKYRDPDNNTYKVWMDERMYQPRFEGQAAYIVPTIRNFVSGPTGMLYNPGTALGPEYKNTFFIVEFVGNPSRSGVHAFKLQPKGAGFDFAESKLILSGVLATGIDFGPDGAMYLADWIQGWDTKDYGRIWKMDVANPNNEERKQTQTLLADDFSKLKPEQLGEILKNADMRVRQKAQFELAGRGSDGLDVFKKYLEQKEHQLARVHSIWGISQFARKNIGDAGLLVPYLKDSDPEIRAQAARWIGDVRYKDAASALLPLLKDESARPRFFAAEALGRIAYEPAIKPLIELLEANNDEDVYIRHAASLALASIGKADALTALANHPSRGVRIAAVVALRRMKSPAIEVFLNDKDEFVVTETARAINDDLSIPDALPALGNILKTTKFKNEALIRRAINANLRVGTDEGMQNLISYLQNESNPVAMRAEAIDALSTWARPSVVDRVDGRYRGVFNRDLATVQSRAATPIINLLTHKETPLRNASLKALGRLKVTQAVPALLTRLKSDVDPQARITALHSLMKIDGSHIEQAIRAAMADKEKNVRVAGLNLLTELKISKDVMVDLLRDVINNRSIEEKQAAINASAKLPIANTQKLYDELIAKAETGKLPLEVQLELADAVAASKSEAMISRVKALNKSTSGDTLKASYAAALLGGDPDRGSRLFWSHPNAQCMRCHAFGDRGGNAGPRLNGVANRLSREQLLEALINPSARLAHGFGSVTLELKNNKKVTGILQKEGTDRLTIKVGDKPDSTIMVKDIAKRTNSPSSMPAMHYILNKKEIRDLVSFLATLKDDN